MIISGFTYFNEKELLRIKLEETRGLEILHVLVESTHTFKGDPKPLNFEKIKDEFSDFDIVYVIVDLEPDKDPWMNEKHQRNAILNGLPTVILRDEDIMIISDCDEVINKKAILEFKPEMECAFLVQDRFDYYLNVREGIQSWNIPKICSWKHLKTRMPDAVRNAGAPHYIHNAGWHFSFQGGIDAIMQKFASFSHQDENTQKHANRSEIERKMKTAESLWGDDKWTVVPIDSSFPTYVVQHQHGLLKHMIYAHP